MLIFGKNIEIKCIKVAFAIVPMPTVKIGIITPEIMIISEKNPHIYPRIVLNKQLNPKGIPVIKSKNNPEAKPFNSPKVFPLSNEKYKRQIKAKSGTT